MVLLCVMSWRGRRISGHCGVFHFTVPCSSRDIIGWGTTSRKVTDSMVSLEFFLLAYSFHPLTEISIRNISWGVKDSRSLGLTTSPTSCADLLEIWKTQPLGTLCVCNRSVKGLLYLSAIVIPVAARSKMWVCGLSLSGIAGSNSARVTDVCFYCECCVLSGWVPYYGLITRPEEWWRVRCVHVCSWTLNNGEALAQ